MRLFVEWNAIRRMPPNSVKIDLSRHTRFNYPKLYRGIISIEFKESDARNKSCGKVIGGAGRISTQTRELYGSGRILIVKHKYI